jgi:fucose permease
MRTSQATIILSCIVFIALGILTATIGPVLPDLARNTLSTLEAVGSIFTAIFLGAFLAQIAAGTLADRFGPRPVLISGIVIMSAGMLGVTLSNSVFLLFASGLLAGLGHGAVDISVNLLAARVFQERSTAAVNLVNFFFGVGAVAGPAMASFTINRWNTGIPVIWVGIGVVLVCIPFIALFMQSPVDHMKISPEGLSRAPFYRSPLLWIAGMILFLYVGSENGMGGWTGTYLQQSISIPADQAALIVSGFWMTLTLGRLIAAYLGTKWTADRLMVISLTGAVFSAVTLALSTGNMVLTVTSILLIGLFFGPVYPTTFSISASLFKESSGKAAGLIVALASLGGMILPPLQGMVLTRLGNQASVAMIAVFSAGMLGVNFIRWQLNRRVENSEIPGAGTIIVKQ